MFTRETFERQRAVVRQVERWDGRVLAIVSVGLGAAQLLFLRWADVHLDRSRRIAIAGLAFLAYVGLVCWLLWRLDRRRRAARPKCPQCGVPLQDLSERVAAATGRCDACGGQVIE
jgi:predicted RNA-binding Zn-ribbon protein involved in translation (DUF1610 family)